MLKSIRLINFKRFDDFKISLSDGNILVGPNNAGKSSILDALRLLEVGLKQARRKPTFIRSQGRSFYGYYISDQQLPFDISNVVKNFNNEDAELIIQHKNGSNAIFLINPERPTRFYIEKQLKQPLTARGYKSAFPVDLLIVPTLGPLELNEKLRKIDTIEKNIGTRIASRNFRNIWKLMPPANFSEFRKRIESAWPGITIEEPEILADTPPTLRMFFKEGRYPREIQWSGYGFQIWLQIQTHLSRRTENSILVLDEPDIYLHPDLQHTLYHDLHQNFKQYVVATHATEIVNEANSNEIIVVDPKNSRGKRVTTDGQYSAMLAYIGSAQNADFAKISRARRVIFVEGKDGRILRAFARRLGLMKVASQNRTPIQELGGFTQFSRAKNTVWAFRKLLNVEIQTLCLFDSDFRSEAEIKNFKNDMTEQKHSCFVLNRKEIENYLLDPVAIAKAANIKLRKSNKEETVTAEIIRAQLDLIYETYKHHTSSQRMASYLAYQSEVRKKEDASVLLKEATINFEARWKDFESKTKLVPGKDVLKNLLTWLQENYSVSLSNSAIINSIAVASFPDDLELILSAADDFME